MNIIISSQSGVPIYEQIKEQIKASILTGELSENTPLPSLRQLARDLQVSLVTTTRAYSELELKETEEALATAIQRGKLAGLSIDDLHEMLNAIERMNK